MTHSWKFIPVSLKYIAIALLLLLTTLGYWFYRHPPIKCFAQESMLTQGLGGSVIVKEDACSGWGGSDVVSIDVLLPTKQRYTVFKYDPAFGVNSTTASQAEPTASWISPQHLKISIARVYFIRMQRERVEDIQISYDVSDVIAKTDK